MFCINDKVGTGAPHKFLNLGPQLPCYATGLNWSVSCIYPHILFPPLPPLVGIIMKYLMKPKPYLCLITCLLQRCCSMHVLNNGSGIIIITRMNQYLACVV